MGGCELRDGGLAGLVHRLRCGGSVAHWRMHCTAAAPGMGSRRNRAATHGTHPVTSVLSAEQVTPLQAGSHGLAVAGPQSPSTSPPLLRAVLNASSVPACSLKVGGGGGEGDGAGLGLGAGSGGGGLGEGTGTGLGTNGDGLGSAGRRGGEAAGCSTAGQ